MEEEKIKELENQIDEWQKELDEVWKGKETDAAEVERRNLKSLIQNAKREINQLRGIDEKVVEGNPEELLEELKNGKAENEKAKKRIELSIERLEDEKIAYESKKNVEYKDIYQEYENKIDELKKQLKELEGKQIEGKDEKIKILTQGRMKEEEEINKIEIEIRKKELEISEIKYGTEEALEEKELSDGTKIKMPKILSKYEELEELKKSLKERTEKRDEYQKYINELKGIEKEEKLEYTKQQVEEYTKYFHGQGDKQENTRDDKRGNDEYFGFEKVREGRKTNEQPKIKPTGKAAPIEKPNPKPPIGKEPLPKKPTDKGTIKNDKNLPIRSFWEIYNDTCTEHVGSIAHNLNKFAHMKILPAKHEDTLHKILSGVLIPFKAAIKVASKVPNAIMQTDKKIEQMQEKIDKLPVEEFQVLVQSPEKVNTMFDENIKDSFDKDYLDPQFMKQYKVNNAYLDVVRTRLGRERGSAIEYYNEQSNNMRTRIQELDEVGKQHWTKEQEDEYNQLIEQYQQNVDEGKKLQEELDTFDEGSKKKSSAYRNISGWFLGKFNPDNREENAKMASLSKARREMARQEDRTAVNAITGQMQQFSIDNTELKGGVKNYIDVGSYSIESPVEALDRGPQTKGRLLLTNIALISSAIGLANQRFNREAIEEHNKHLEQVNQENQHIKVSGEVKVSDSKDSVEAQEAITRQTVEAGWNRAERGDLAATNWNFGNKYHERDAISHAEGAEVATEAEEYLQQGETLKALKTSTDYYTKVQESNRSDIADYMSTHPQHDYFAFEFGDSADMSKIYNFFENGVIPYETEVNGVLAELMPSIKSGMDLNAIIFAGANALYQAQREGKKDLRKQIRVTPTKKTEQNQQEESNERVHTNDEERV